MSYHEVHAKGDSVPAGRFLELTGLGDRPFDTGRIAVGANDDSQLG